LIKLKNISLSYQDKEVVKKINFSLQNDEILVIVGASGCGKTTLLKAIAGFHPIVKGQILLNGEPIKDPTQQLVPGNPKIKLVNQDFDLNDYHTVEENLKLKLLQFDKEYLELRIEELLNLTELTKYKHQIASELSGGQKQRLAIARALADEPELLLLDEPFNQLDYHLKNKIENYIINYTRKNNIALILVTHNGEEAMRWANQVAFMKNGKINRIDTPENFYNQPTNKYEANFFGKLNTILIDRKEVSFRPHHFSLKPKKNYLKLETKFVNKIDNGWFTNYQFSFGKRFFNLYAQTDLSDIKVVWINPLRFR
jgi:ABC-type Fe3+/spermidine/putrescine transport system ATPase subunit